MRRVVSIAVFVILAACHGNRLFEGKLSQAGTSQPSTEPEPTDSQVANDDEESAAMEPVAIGGAYLACQYQETLQGSSEYLLDCTIGPESPLSAPLAKAEFAKVDANGEHTALTASQEDLIGLKWTLRETSGTLSLTQVEVRLHTPGFLSSTLSATVTTGVPMKPEPSFWLGGEPNNQLYAGGPNAENCVEFDNQAGKISHQNSSGLTTGIYGRLNDVPCNRTQSYLCRKTDGSDKVKWLVSSFQGTWQTRAQACPTGYAFGAPASEAEVAEAGALIDANPAVVKFWVNMNDNEKEGLFITHY